MNERKRTYNDGVQKTKERAKGTYLKLRPNVAAARG